MWKSKEKWMSGNIGKQQMDQKMNLPMTMNSKTNQLIEFEDLVYELSQTYEMEPEYESMTVEQEAGEVQALSSAEQAKYRELTRLHQRQADIERRITGVSKMIKERTKARAPGLLIDLITRSVQVEPAERQELH